MDSAKKRGSRKFFMCFRPIDTDDRSLKPHRADAKGDPVFAYISVQGDEKMVLPKILTSLSGDKSTISSDAGLKRKEKSHRSFSRLIKAVLFETSLAKKVRSRKARQKSSTTKSNIESERNKNVSKELIEKPAPRESSEAEDRRINSSCWPSLNSSSSVTASTSLFSSRPSSVTSNSRSSSQRKGSFRANSIETKQIDRLLSTEKVRECYYSSNVGLCSLLVCLVALIFWGKVCAIFCTSTCFFLVPRRIRQVASLVNGVDSTANGIDSPEIDPDSGAYKKKIIMEGLLQRNRSRVIPQVR